MRVGSRNWLLLAFVLVGVCCGCCGCSKKIYVPTPISSSTRIVDTLVKTVADSAVIKALFECDSNNRVVLRQLSQLQGAESSARVDVDSAGRVEVVTRWKTEYIDRIKETRDTITVVEVREVVQTVKHVPRFFWGCFVFSILSLGVVILKFII